MTAYLETDAILLDRTDFISEMKQLAALKQWKLPSDEALGMVYEIFPKNGATKQPFVDAGDFFRAVERMIATTDRTVPSDIKTYYDQVRREKVKAIAEAQAKPELPAPVGRDMPEEYIRFTRLRRDMQVLRAQTSRKSFTQAEYDERWNRPLTDDDWHLGRKTQPAAAIAGTLGGNVPARDPKEGDVVWVD